MRITRFFEKDVADEDSVDVEVEDFDVSGVEVDIVVIVDNSPELQLSVEQEQRVSDHPSPTYTWQPS